MQDLIIFPTNPRNLSRGVKLYDECDEEECWCKFYTNTSYNGDYGIVYIYIPNKPVLYNGVQEWPIQYRIRHV